MIENLRLELFGKILMFLGFVIIIFNAIVYIFRFWFSWSWLSLIGLVLVIIGLRIRRISKETKEPEFLQKKKVKGVKK